jgi:DNA mismatch repair protein MutL
MEPSEIRPLSASLVNRIAAGEVIERPASVVKELVENSLDAGATSILVEIEDGGRELIRVVDDGCGIEPAQLPLALAEHATSKLRDDDDLFRITTMGFRGEALASIAAVSHCRLLSRTRQSDSAWELLCRGGQTSEPQASAGNVGTTLEVRHLFFNTPARRKFLKGAPTELGHVSDALLRLALARPDVSFKLLHHDRVTLELPACAARDRLLAAWPDDFAKLAIDIEAHDVEVTLTGIVGRPELARPTAKHQYFYVNGRCVRDKYIQHALREAFRGLTEPGRHPAAVLLLSLPPADVDVNVHPTKSEIRFRDSSRIHGLVMSGVRQKLLASDLAPAAVASRVDGLLPTRMDMRQTLADFFRGSSTPALSAVDGPTSDVPTAPPAGDWTAPPPDAMPTRTDFAPWSLRSPAHQATFPTSPALPAAFAPPAAGEIQAGAASPSPLDAIRASAGDVDRLLAARQSPLAAIQLHNSYLIVQSEDGLLIIDQHALHERILYEDLLARLTRGPLESQRMLIPMLLPATPRRQEIAESISGLLRRLGIEIVPFGPDSIAIQAFPSFLSRLEPVEFVSELLERGEQELLDLTPEELLHEVLDMMACKAAVKAGDPLTPGEIEAMLNRRHLVDRSSNCPHGRPTTLRLTLGDLEKQFKRTGF